MNRMNPYRLHLKCNCPFHMVQKYSVERSAEKSKMLNVFVYVVWYQTRRNLRNLMLVCTAMNLL